LIEHAGSSIQPGTIYDLARVFGTSIMATALRCQHIFGVSLFQVEDARLAWGYGLIRHQRDLHSHIDRSDAVITQAMEGVPGETAVYLNGSEYTCTWVSTRGQRRALFLLQVRQMAQQDIKNQSRDTRTAM